ncbi:hypothetical protein AVEN_271715-1 [Araneus ventricosus]|uniref:Uncharacterized protein n=1 Tax=Araneus ventricosus TaxID=182803 RepID=A0A4Y2P634_ARAVE|nr:hypothetical protein AVEN_271715-1 [Araneus ventricosus]
MEEVIDGVLVSTENCGTRKRQRTGGKRTEAKKKRYSAPSGNNAYVPCKHSSSFIMGKTKEEARLKKREYDNESGHGKGAPDGIGAALKRTADRQVAEGKDVHNYNTLVSVFRENCQGITIFEVTDNDIQKCDQLTKGEIKQHLSMEFLRDGSVDFWILDMAFYKSDYVIARSGC